MEPGVKRLLKQHAPYLVLEEDGKIQCPLNGHRLPPTLAAVQSFINGAKFQRLVKRAEAEAGFKQYEPFIIPSRNMPDKLYCALTCMLVGKNADSVARHLKGKAYTKAKERFQKGEHQLMEEPELEDESEPSGSEPEQDEPELREGLEDMELDLADSQPESDAAGPSPPVQSGRQKSGKKQAGKGKGGKAGKAVKVKASEDAPQPETPPQQPGSKVAKGAEADAARPTKRLRAGGSRPKKVKRAAE